jgi:diacylglycerol kinase (ATP)
MSAKNMIGITHFVKAFSWSLAGFKAAWQNETAFRQEVIGLLFFIPLGFWLGDDALERGALVASLLFVLVVELINSAIEAVVDRVGLEHHHLSGRAKDLGSAAVFLSLVITAVVWGLLLVEKYLKFIS